MTAWLVAVLVWAVYAVWVFGVTVTDQAPFASVVVAATVRLAMSSNWRARIVIASPAFAGLIKPLRRTFWQQIVELAD